MKSKSKRNEKVSVSIGRRPIFDEQMHLWGYELFCVGDGVGTLSGIPDDNRVSVNVAASAYMGLQQILSRGKKIIVSFDEKNILDNLPYALPSVLGVVKVNESMFNSSHVKMLETLKRDGYQVAVDDFSGRPGCASLYALADILCLQIEEKSKTAITAILNTVDRQDALLMARRVQDETHFNLCRELRFSLFEGGFFKSSEIMTMRKLSSNKVARLNLLNLLQSEKPDLKQLAEAIQTDASVSFRLLTYLNSSAFGLPQKIKSIQQALTILGWRKIKKWLHVLLLADMNEDSDSEDFFFLAAQRAKFLELVTQAHDFWGFDPENLHLLGLFSLLDTMLGAPMVEIVGFLPIENKIKSALCGETNNEFHPLLQLVRSFEEGNWNEADTLIQQLNLDVGRTKTAFKEALDWAAQVTTLQDSGKSQLLGQLDSVNAGL